MENLNTYLPDVTDETLNPFFKASERGNLSTVISDHVRSVVADLDYISEETILSDIDNLDIVIRGFIEERNDY